MSAAHQQAMPPEIRKWLTGRCSDFALALLERFPDGELVAFGSEKWPDHVGVFFGGLYYDARGEMTLEEFCTRFRGAHRWQPEEIRPISVKLAEYQAGVGGLPAPYRGVKEIEEARRSVRKIFGPKPRGSVSPAPRQ